MSSPNLPSKLPNGLPLCCIFLQKESIVPALKPLTGVGMATHFDSELLAHHKASWGGFFQLLRSRGLDRVKFIVWDKFLDMLEAAGEVFPEA